MSDFHRMFEDYRRMLSEDPDSVYVGSEGEQETYVAYWMDDDAVPFGYYKGKMYVELMGSTHDNMMVPKTKKKGIRNKLSKLRKAIAPTGEELAGIDLDNYEFIDRKKLQFAGRLWLKKKIISFWEYPPKNQLKKVMKDINDAIANYDVEFAKARDYHIPKSTLRYKITPEWKIDIPNDVAFGEMKKNKLGYFDRREAPRGDMDYRDAYSYLYKIKNVLAGKIKPKVKFGQVWRDMGINMDSGQAHLDSPVKKKLQNLPDRDKTKLWNYLKNQGQLSPAEIAMYRFMAAKKKIEDDQREREVNDLMDVLGGKGEYGLDDDGKPLRIRGFR